MEERAGEGGEGRYRRERENEGLGKREMGGDDEGGREGRDLEVEAGRYCRG